MERTARDEAARIRDDHEVVRIGPTKGRFADRRNQDRVVARAAIELVEIRAAIQRVAACATVEVVAAVPGIDGVVLDPAVQRFRAVRTVDHSHVAPSSVKAMVLASGSGVRDHMRGARFACGPMMPAPAESDGETPSRWTKRCPERGRKVIWFTRYLRQSATPTGGGLIGCRLVPEGRGGALGMRVSASRAGTLGGGPDRNPRVGPVRAGAGAYAASWV